jgi:ABC-type sugar transport system ATPase subunit
MSRSARAASSGVTCPAPALHDGEVEHGARDGRVEQLGTPEDVYCRSATDFVAQFIGLAARHQSEQRRHRSAR